MDRLEVVVAVEHFPIGACPAVDFIVNGVSLLDAIEAAVPGHGGGYGGLKPEQVLPWLREPLPHEQLFRGVFYGCSCGVAKCSQVTGVVRRTARTVGWGRFLTSADEPLHNVGPFLFESRYYAAALSAPREVARPLHHQQRES